MAYLSLYRKYRPQTFADLLGQEHVSNTLANALVEGRVSHAYLFTGPRGTGKTSTARILAKALNCEKGPTPQPCGVCESCRSIANGSSLDVIEMDAASHSKVDETREILAGVPLASAGGRRKVYVIDEVHMLSQSAFNALLKTLEEPPQHVVFILATTEVHKVLPTIVSRTQRFDFRRVPAQALEKLLTRVAGAEGIEVEPAGLAIIARHANGGARDALSILDQLSNFTGTITAADVERLLGAGKEGDLADLFEAVSSGSVGEVFSIVHALIEKGADARQMAEGALHHARSLLLLRTAPDADGLLDATGENRARLAAQAERWTDTGLVRTLDLLGKALIDMRNASNHRLYLEVALVRATAPDSDPSPAGLLRRIERLERRAGIEADAAATAQASPEDASHASRVPPPSARPPAHAGTPGEGSSRKAPSRARPGPAGTPPAEAASPPAPAEKASPARAESGPSQPGEGREPVAPVARPPAEGVGLGHIRDAWPAVLAEVSRASKRVWGLMSGSHPVGFQDGKLTVEVQYSFHQQELSKGENRDLVVAALHAALGIKPVLEFVERGRQAPVAGPDDDAAAYERSTPVEQASDEAIKLVKDGFKAEVIEERS